MAGEALSARTGVQGPGRGDPPRPACDCPWGQHGASEKPPATTRTADSPTKSTGSIELWTDITRASRHLQSPRPTRAPKRKTASEGNQASSRLSHVSRALTACPFGSPKPPATCSTVFARQGPQPRASPHSPPAGGTLTPLWRRRGPTPGRGAVWEPAHLPLVRSSSDPSTPEALLRPRGSESNTET